MNSALKSWLTWIVPNSAFTMILLYGVINEEHSFIITAMVFAWLTIMIGLMMWYISSNPEVFETSMDNAVKDNRIDEIFRSCDRKYVSLVYDTIMLCILAYYQFEWTTAFYFLHMIGLWKYYTAVTEWRKTATNTNMTKI